MQKTKKHRKSITNKTSRIIFVLLFLFAIGSICAQGTPGLAFTSINNGTAYEVSRGTANAAHIEIPDTYNGLSVTKIADSAFYGYSGLTSITIPNSVTNIGYLAFYSCTGLTSVTIPNSVTSIGREAFSGWIGLTSITIPSSVTSIEYNPFTYCSSLETIVVSDENTYFRGEGNNLIRNSDNALVAGTMNSVIPDNVTSIGIWAFLGYTGLSSINIPNSVTSIGNQAFYGCSDLTSISIPNSVTSIGGWAFQDCIGLTSVIIGNGVTSIGIYPFQGCTGVTSFSVDSDAAVRAFSGSTSLTTVTIGNSVTNIGATAFTGCTGLNSIFIPNSVTNIGAQAFRDCTSLNSIFIPNSVTSIGLWTFRDCTNLTIYAEAASQPESWHEDWNYSNRPVVWNSADMILLPPTNLNSYVSGYDITLTWDAPLSSIVPLESYRIFQENNLLADEHDTLMFIDSRSTHGTYNYQVMAVYSGGISAPITTTATILPPRIVLNPAENFNFGEQAVNNETEQEIGIMNTLGGVLIVNNIIMAAGSSQMFSLVLPEMPINIIGGESASFVIVYQPTTIDSHSGVIMINNNTDEPVILLQITGSATNVSDDDIVNMPIATELRGNYPNPFNPETVIRFSVALESIVLIDIYNIRGQKVRSLLNDFVNRGEHSVVWNGRDDSGSAVGSGVYFYRMITDDAVFVKRMMLMK